MQYGSRVLKNRARARALHVDHHSEHHKDEQKLASYVAQHENSFISRMYQKFVGR